MFRRFLFLLALLITFSIPILGKTKWQGIVSKGGLVISTSPTNSYNTIESYPNSTITVYLTGTTTLASIYSNDAGTIKSNPFTANSDASYNFYIDNGRYDVKFSGTGIATPFTLSDITIGGSSSSSGSSSSGDTSLFNPLAYGAICDGIIDDTIAIRAMVAALHTNGGGTIQLPPKPCLIGISSGTTPILTFTVPFNIRGSSWASRLRIKATTPNTVGVILIKPDANSGITGSSVSQDPARGGWGISLENFAIEAESGTPGAYAIKFDFSNANSFIRNLFVKQIFIGKINNGTGEGAGSGIIFDGGGANGGPFTATFQNNLFKRGVIMNSAGDTISFTNTNRFEGPQLALEYSAVAGATTLLFDNNNVYAAGFHIRTAQNATITNNIFEMSTNALSGGQFEVDPYGSGGAVVNLDGIAPNKDYNVTFSRNVIGTFVTLDGLRINSLQGATIEDNQIAAPVGKYYLVITSNAYGTNLCNNLPLISSATSIADPAVSYCVKARANVMTPDLGSDIGNIQITGMFGSGNHPLDKWSFSDGKKVFGIKTNSLLSNNAEFDMIFNLYNDGTNLRSVTSGNTSYLSLTQDKLMFFASPVAGAPDVIVTPTERFEFNNKGLLMLGTIDLVGQPTPASASFGNSSIYVNNTDGKTKISQAGNGYSDVMLSYDVSLNYNFTGVRQYTTHAVYGFVTLSGGAATITLTGASVFTNSSSYICTTSNQTAANGVRVQYISGSQINLTGTGSDVISIRCEGQ